MSRIPNFNTFADVVDRLIVEVNKLSVFENRKREEQAQVVPNSDLIAKWDNMSRDCCELRNMLKLELNKILTEIVETGVYKTLDDVRTFNPPKKTVEDIIVDMCEKGPDAARTELAESLECFLNN